jgi:hypothetical protein
MGGYCYNAASKCESEHSLWLGSVDRLVTFVVSYRLGGAFMGRAHATTCHLITREMKTLSIEHEVACRPECAVAKKSHQFHMTQ